MKIKFNAGYAVAFLALLAVIVYIALFVTQPFIRHHFGDVLIMWFMYCFFRLWWANPPRLLWVWLFMFATAVEVGQYFGLVYLLGLGHSQLARIVIGVTFDWWDIVMYGAGAVGIAVYEQWVKISQKSIHS